MRIRILAILVSLLNFVPALFAQPVAKSHPLLGTWELVSRKSATGATTPVAENTRRLKMYTSTHYVVFSYDTATHMSPGMHGGRWESTTDGFIEMPEFATTGSAWIKDYVGKQMTFKTKFEGDTFTQSGQVGTAKFEEVWRRASATDAAVAAPTAAVGKPMTLTAEAICAKCALHQAQSCQLALRGVGGGQSLSYFLAPEATRQRLERQLWDAQHVDWCTTPTRVVATGVATQVDGRPVFNVTRLEQAR